MPFLCLLVLWLLNTVSAQYPPAPDGVTVLNSSVITGARIQYKEPGLCETTPGVKSYSGYIKLPAGSLQDTGVSQNYDINLFFWYFRARKAPGSAPLGVWLTGGPGASSTKGIFQENGPCFVNADSRSTRLNPWSWNREVNMLYIDQPVQSGLSYDRLVNGTLDLFTDRLSRLSIPNFKRGKNVKQTTSMLVGTFPSNNYATTTNTSANAAKALWHAMQVFLNDFPESKSSDSRVSIWSESYGGRYGPRSAAFFQRQNEKIQAGKLQNKAYKPINLDALGIVAGCVDKLTEGISATKYAYNNTFGLRIVNEAAVRQAEQGWPSCQSALVRCKQAVEGSDPENTGANSQVNSVCMSAFQSCSGPRFGDRSAYDIAAPTQDPDPHPYMIGYLARQDVQKALGVPVNYTEVIESVNQVFTKTGDMNRPGPMDDLAYLLDNGIKVHMMYGDRDGTCNWIGGETVSLAIKHREKSEFKSAGYGELKTNSSYTGGSVRQHNGLSFALVFQAGHSVPWYQPQTAYEVFRRATSNLDIATGTVPTAKSGGGSTYSSRGAPNALGVSHVLPPMPKPTCYLLMLQATCPSGIEAKLRLGQALIKDYIVS
ncbi:putative carboxypeptidase S1 [Microthyrium microscopicum]|uniref:Putative carboxypeptidase S1 n=1 Tax=Microthyrium microscopicum TaxID=703497 RepID=A0A6A6U157_9PEZI|nr:putative carboxypeptidase S1 [Microthyrium microscopicum]